MPDQYCPITALNFISFTLKLNAAKLMAPLKDRLVHWIKYNIYKLHQA